MELILRLFTQNNFFGLGLIFITFFSAATGLGLYGISTLFSEKAARRFAGTVMCVLGVLFATQIIYHSVFNNFLIVFSLKAGGAGQIIETGIVENTIKAIVGGIPAILLLSVPAVIVFTPIGKNIEFEQCHYLWFIAVFVCSFALQFITIGIVALVPSLAPIQGGLFDPNLSANNFGLLRTEVLDIKYNLIGVEQNVELEPEPDTPDQPSDEEEDEPVVYKPNQMDIDFTALSEGESDKNLVLMNEYFGSKKPTYQNEYTGMYKGYNLISITAEGFSPYAIDPVLTPTLYKMQQEGWDFSNFYTPIWGVSTSDGEYTACTGLIPKSGVWSFYRSGNNYMPFCLGNMFRSIGIENTYAYHNNTHSYYHRDVSHPNMGYNYKGMGTGVEKYVKKVWPQSDLEMVSGSLPEYLSSDKPFHAYYMTVSGHLEYSRIGNMMTAKNWDAVKDLTCSDTLKAYYACNIELDRAMEHLLKALNDAGIADKTVISITPDHYPYGLEQDEGDKYAIWTEMLGHKVETSFELYESCWLLYCQGTANPPKVDKYCYSVDILPTILNLFGFEYDSRLLMGSDVMSTEEGLVVFSNRSFITNLGKYDSTTKIFTPFSQDAFATQEDEDKYVRGMIAVVNNKFKMSAKILEKDYYRYVFK